MQPDRPPHAPHRITQVVDVLHQQIRAPCLNNLNDITVDAKYSAICGYTEEDLDQVFAPELDGLDRDEIRRWYNGYNWTGESVYNPFDVLLFDKRDLEGCALQQIKDRGYANKYAAGGHGDPSDRGGVQP